MSVPCLSPFSFTIKQFDGVIYKENKFIQLTVPKAGKFKSMAPALGKGLHAAS